MSTERRATEERFAFLLSYEGKALQPILDTFNALGADPDCSIEELVDFAISPNTKKCLWAEDPDAMVASVEAIVRKANNDHDMLRWVVSKVFRSMLSNLKET